MTVTKKKSKKKSKKKMIQENIKEEIHQQLQKHFGFSSFKKGQMEVIARILDGQSAGAIFPTGAGKSLCYQLSAMMMDQMTLLVSPLLSLMKDQMDFLQSHNIPAERLDSSLSREEYNSVIQRAKKGELKILMISVERFKNERFRQHLKKMAISLLAIDEAHCISEWGHNFRPEYLKLPQYQREFDIDQVLLLTATATEKVVVQMAQKFAFPQKNITITGFYRKNLFLQVTPVLESEKKTALLHRLQEDPQAPTIVYVTLQKKAQEVADFLRAHEIDAQPYHAGLAKEEREHTQTSFMEGHLNCVVATIAFGMGIDKRNLRRVIHYDLPKSIENYSQEIGRSGRDDKDALCEVLANRDNIYVLENFIYGDTPQREAIEALLMEIKENRGRVWEVKEQALSKTFDIRVLPLKTLLVYLDMEGVLKSQYSYFEEYSFKYKSNPQDILGRFQGERREFLQALIDHCQTKKIWTYVDTQGMMEDYNTNRERIIIALEYFDEKGWLQLFSRQSVQVYHLLNQTFDLQEMTEKIHQLFCEKEAYEIQRIHSMVDFFQGGHCLSKGLASYFGEKIPKKKCGHCSVCKGKKATLQNTTELPPLSKENFQEITQDFRSASFQALSPVYLTKFLCGIYTPAFAKLRVKRLSHYGHLEGHAYQDVARWVGENLKGKF